MKSYEIFAVIIMIALCTFCGWFGYQLGYQKGIQDQLENKGEIELVEKTYKKLEWVRNK